MDEELLSGVGTVLAALFKGYNDHLHQFIALLPSQVRHTLIPNPALSCTSPAAAGTHLSCGRGPHLRAEA